MVVIVRKWDGASRVRRDALVPSQNYTELYELNKKIGGYFLRTVTIATRAIQLKQPISKFYVMMR